MKHKVALNEHVIDIASPPSRLYPEIVKWGEGEWWPQGSFMKFVNLSGRREEGAVYLMKVCLPFGPGWYARITELKEDESVRRDFIDGMFAGYEVVSIEDAPGGSRLCYRMHYRVKGFFNRIIWSLIAQRLHNRNIRRILRALKNYLENEVEGNI